MTNSGGLVLALRYLLPLLALVTLVFGLFTDSMDVDATQYALMSKELLESDNWLHFYCRGVPYLDKPPLIFWSTALSYKIFGVTNWAYKLPSLLVMLLGTYGLYRASKIWYNQRTAEISATVFTFSFWFIMIAQDVKTDNLLIGFSCLSFWSISEWLNARSLKWILLTAVFQAFALMAKGPIATVSLFSGIGLHLMIKKDWKKILDWHWLLLIATIVLLLAPMTFGLYTQYGKEGVLFFYWTQSFGRITGASSWSNELGPDFFIHTTLWAFLPWTPIAVIALLNSLSVFFSTEKRSRQSEWLTVGSFLLPFIALSTSRFKLPHYIFITYPYLSIITAIYLDKIIKHRLKMSRLWSLWSIVILVVVALLVTVILTVVFPSKNYLLFTLLSGLLFIGIISLYHSGSNSTVKWVMVPALAITILGLTLNFHFYPNLLDFQSGSVAGRWIKEHCQPDHSVFGYRLFGYSLDLYANRRVEQIEDIKPVIKDLKLNKRVFLLLKNEDFEILRNQGINLNIQTNFPSFHISLLTPDFLNPTTRSKALETIYMAEVSLTNIKP